MTPSPKTPVPVVRVPQHRVKSYTPPIVPGHHQGYIKRSGREKDKPREIEYFAGAKFDCLPSVSSLPTPPSEWTIPVLRSQSQPSSPVTTGVRIDLNSLFLTPQVIKVSEAAAARDINNKAAKAFAAKKQIEIDTQLKTASSDDKQMTKKQVDDMMGYARKVYDSRRYEEEAMLKVKQETRPIDINPRPLGSQPKQSYPHLSEHLKCLLKVQG